MNQVTCATKKGNNYSPYERISLIGGYTSEGKYFKIASNDAIEGIDSGKYSFYVEVSGKKVAVITAVKDGKKYLKTEADGFEPNNLLALGDC